VIRERNVEKKRLQAERKREREGGEREREGGEREIEHHVVSIDFYTTRGVAPWWPGERMRCARLPPACLSCQRCHQVSFSWEIKMDACQRHVTQLNITFT